MARRWPTAHKWNAARQPFVPQNVENRESGAGDDGLSYNSRSSLRKHACHVYGNLQGIG